jgi:hypothetical protein
VFVDLVGDHGQVAFPAQIGDGGQLGRGEDLAGGVVGGVEDEEPGARGDGGAQGVRIDGETILILVQNERHRDQAGAAEPRPGRVGVVARVEGDHLVAGAGQGEERRGQRLRRARRDQHLAVRRHLQAVTPQLVRGDGLAQRGDAEGGRVLVVPGQHGGGDVSQQRGRRVEVGHALAEVDGPGAAGQLRHLREDGCLDRAAHVHTLRCSGQARA